MDELSVRRLMAILSKEKERSQDFVDSGRQEVLVTYHQGRIDALQLCITLAEAYLNTEPFKEGE